MRKIETRALTKKDIESLSLDPLHKEMLALNGINEMSFALTHENNVLACCGILQYWEGVGESWIELADGAEKYSALPGAVRDILNETQDLYCLHRVVSTVRADNPKDIRFVQWLGYEWEGLMRKHGVDGSDYHLYARVK